MKLEHTWWLMGLHYWVVSNLLVVLVGLTLALHPLLLPQSHAILALDHILLSYLLFLGAWGRHHPCHLIRPYSSAASQLNSDWSASWILFCLNFNDSEVWTVWSFSIAFWRIFISYWFVYFMWATKENVASIQFLFPSLNRNWSSFPFFQIL